MDKTVRDFFMYGTQYHRAPTPLPGEWEEDLINMGKVGLNTIQLRTQWRWHEPRENEYRFDETDRLFDLSAKHGKKVIFNFLMDCAPDYVFQTYGGARKDMNGLPMNPGAHGAYYVGGWLPCFTNPHVARRAQAFARVFAERYKDRENLLAWKVWKEPRSRPIGDCGCEHSIRSYRNWLKENYGTIEALNDAFGKRWGDFETIMPPAMPWDYTELFLWRKWAIVEATKKIQFMYETVKAIDDSRPLISHVGQCSVVQDIAWSGSDDLVNARVVDFFGTSLPTAIPALTNIMEEAAPAMICDWLRSVSPYYWVNELYTDWGDWNEPISVEDFRFKVWTTVACGAKGILYWQYRAERVGNENDLSGMVDIDGSFRPITHEVGKIAEVIEKHKDMFLNAEVEEAEVAILYSPDSDMINRVENTGGDDYWDFVLTSGFPYLYKKALFGTYALFRELGVAPRWIDVRTLKESLDSVKLLYLPECFMVPDGVVDLLEAFAGRGGCIVAEEGLGLRGENTWLNPRWPAERLSDLFGVRAATRRTARRGVVYARISGEAIQGIKEDFLTMPGGTIEGVGFNTYLEVKDAVAVGSWQDGRVGATRKGNLYYIGTSLGACFHDRFETHYADCTGILSHIAEECGIETGRLRPAPGVYARELVSGRDRIGFIFNRTAAEQCVKLSEEIESVEKITDFALSRSGGKGLELKVGPGEVAVYAWPRKGAGN